MGTNGFFTRALRSLAAGRRDRDGAGGDRLLNRLRAIESELARRTVYLGDHECLTRMVSGHKIYVDSRDVSIASHLMIDGCWEPWIAAVLMPLVRPGMRVCDIGANFGYYTLLMASAVGAEGHVWSVEANPRMVGLLRKSVAVNGLGKRVTLIEAAAWDRDEPLDFFVNDAMSGGGRVRPPGARGGGERTTVAAKRLDGLIDGPLDVIKIDVEGAEERALAGLAATIDASPRLAIVMEYYAPAFRDPVAFFEAFAAKGFSGQVIRPAGLGPELAPGALVGDLAQDLGYVLLQRR
jgi:FkbM family methyltransferase